MTNIMQIAQERIRKAPESPKRYGLSTIVRRPLPDMDTVTPTKHPELSVSGHDAVQITFDQLSSVHKAIIAPYIDDPSVAAHLIHGSSVTKVIVPANADVHISLQQLMVFGAWTTLVVEVQKGSKVVMEEGIDPILGSEYGSTLVVLDIQDGAHVEWYSGMTHIEPPCFIGRLIRVGRDATVFHVGTLSRATSVREHIMGTLSSPGASMNVRSMFVGNEKEQYDLSVHARHAAPDTVSDLQTKGVLGGAAQAVYRGLVRVDRGAPRSNGEQRVDTLITSPAAEADAVPNLEIETDDVRCTHGATTSRVKEEDLFYLQSRGISKNNARTLIVQGFIQRILNEYPEHMRSVLENLVLGQVGKEKA